MGKRNNRAKSLFEKVAAESAEEQKHVKSIESVQQTNNDVVATAERSVEVIVPTAQDDNIVDDNIADGQIAIEDDPLKKFKDMLPVNANAADRKKLELYDKLYNEFKAKTDENAKLSNKVYSYVEQIDELKAEIKELKASKIESEQCAATLSAELASLREKMLRQQSGTNKDSSNVVDALRAENNELSQKIAQQAFEIATLKSTCRQQGQQMFGMQPIPRQPSHKQQKAERQNPDSVQYSYRNNGYSDWN